MAWANAAQACKPAFLVDCFGQTVDIQDSFAIRTGEELKFPWHTLCQSSLVSSSRRLSSALNYEDSGLSLDFLAHLRPQGPQASDRKETFATLRTRQDVLDLSTAHIRQARSDNLQVNSSRSRASDLDTWGEWTMALKLAPFRYYWILGDRMPTAVMLHEEAVWIHFQAYLAQRVDYKTADNILASVLNFHRDYLQATGLSRLAVFKRQRHHSEKAALKQNPTRRRRDIAPPKVWVLMIEWWESKAQACEKEADLASAVYWTMPQLFVAAAYTPGFRLGSICPGQPEWQADAGTSNGHRREYWTLRTLVQLEQLRPLGDLSEQAVSFHHQLGTSVSEDFLLLPPPKQKTTYTNPITNEIATKPWPHQNDDHPLSITSVFRKLATRLDVWHPGWRQTAHVAPVAFNPHQKSSFPDVQPFSSAECLDIISVAASAVLRDTAPDLVISDHSIRNSCHMAWTMIEVPVASTTGTQWRRLTSSERDAALARGRVRGEHRSSAYNYDQVDIPWLLQCTKQALRVDFQTSSSVRSGKPVSHDEATAITASHVRRITQVDERQAKARKLSLAKETIKAASAEVARLEAVSQPP